MTRKDEFISKYPQLSKGKHAYTNDGESLGKIIELEEDSVIIEKGFFFPKDFYIRYDDIKNIRDNSVTLKQNQYELREWQSEQYKGWEEYARANEEVEIPRREEELKVKKGEKKAGEVRVRKVVHTEMKNLEIPVTKEDVVVERTPVDETREPKAGEKPFQEEEVRIPLSEEEVKVEKEPKVKEEIRVRKESKTEEEEVRGKTRKEDVKVERDDEHGRHAA